MSLQVVEDSPQLDEVLQAKIDLAAAHRLAVKYELEEGIDNHFTVTVPGTDDRFMILPFGKHWSEARASDMIIFDEAGTVIEGSGDLELSAYCIHAPIHRLTGTRVVLHTHQTWATALNMLEDNRLIPSSQTAAYFHGQIAYDDTYAGTADVTEEGERLAALMGDKTVMFMKNHGVLTIGNTVAEAFKRLYLIERVARMQILALSTGKPLARLDDDLVSQVQSVPEDESHSRSERVRLYFEAMKRVLDQEMPGYAS